MSLASGKTRRRTMSSKHRMPKTCAACADCGARDGRQEADVRRCLSCARRCAQMMPSGMLAFALHAGLVQVRRVTPVVHVHPIPGSALPEYAVTRQIRQTSPTRHWRAAVSVLDNNWCGRVQCGRKVGDLESRRLPSPGTGLPARPATRVPQPWQKSASGTKTTAHSAQSVPGRPPSAWRAGAPFLRPMSLWRGLGPRALGCDDEY